MQKLLAIAATALTLAAAQPVWAQASGLDDVRKLIDKAEYAEAMQAVTSSKDTRGALLRAEIELRTGKYVEAEKSAARAAEDPAQRGDAAALRAEALAARGKHAEAIKVLREVEKEPSARRARLLLGEYLIATGKRGDARAPLMTLVADYNRDVIKNTDAAGLTLVGRAAHLLRSARDANDAYNGAEKAGGKQRVDTLLYRADLFLDKYDPGHAAQVVKEAEQLAPKDPRVRVYKARVMLENAMDFGGAEAEIRRALDVNPNLTEAYFVRAGLALRDLDIDAADKAADQGLAVNPNDLELLSMKAAIRFLADDKKGFQRFESQILGLNPEYSALYRIVGEFAEWEHRYDDIVKFMEKAIAVDARDAKAHALLGLNLIRGGDEQAGVEALRKAWDKDKFNVRVFNTLNLFERDIANGYVMLDGQTFRIRYAKEERAILERYVPKLLEEAWGSMVKRYRFTPKTPVSIELYADDEHFSVRTSGLPNVGIQGVCFGQTLALMSPRAAPFNWGNVLWHELGHVFAIQMSKNHVPRWYTEGLSEYETIVRRPEWQREEDAQLYAALKSSRVPPVTGFNRAFTHVDDVEDVTMAYYAASQIVVFMIERYGWDKVISMMPRWAEGARTPEVIKASLGVTADELDREYRAWLRKKLARYEGQYVPDLHAPGLEDAEEAAKKAPKDARKQLELAVARLRAGKSAEGRVALEEALRIDPSQPDALYVSAELALADEKLEPKAKAARARELLQRMIAAKHDGYAVRMKLAGIAFAEEQLPAAKEALAAAHALDPSQPEPLTGLIALARKVRDERTELAHLKKYVLLEQHDREAWGRLLEGSVARNRWEEAVQVGESALFVDVANPEVHRLYARALAKSGRHLSAIYEYNSAIVAGAPPVMAVEIYRELAKGYDKLGQPKLAEQARAYEKKMAARAAQAKSPKR
jgi:tetratricopeptide (TPR) repeat protein